MDFWVAYKLIGGFALTFTYITLTLVYLHRLGLLTARVETTDAHPATRAGTEELPGTTNVGDPR